jgi:hypothetical protein
MAGDFCLASPLESTATDSVTATGTAILVLLDRTVTAANVVSLASEIICVTGGAERLVLGKRPGDRGADGRTVTAGTAGIYAVIARVVSIPIMAEVGRRPAVGGMAGVALRGGR